MVINIGWLICTESYNLEMFDDIVKSMVHQRFCVKRVLTNWKKKKKR